MFTACSCALYIIFEELQLNVQFRSGVVLDHLTPIYNKQLSQSRRETQGGRGNLEAAPPWWLTGSRHHPGGSALFLLLLVWET